MLPVNVLLTPHTLATPFCETRFGSGVSLAVIERFRNDVPPAHGVRVGVLAPRGALPYLLTGVATDTAPGFTICAGVDFLATTIPPVMSRTPSVTAVTSISK